MCVVSDRERTAEKMCGFTVKDTHLTMEGGGGVGEMGEKGREREGKREEEREGERGKGREKVEGSERRNGARGERAR